MDDEQIHILPGPNEPIQVFVSYAHDDNSVPPGLSPDKGFVSVLLNHLNYVLTKRGHPKPKIWWDQRAIDKADRFDHHIQNAVKRSSILLVVMSTNWLSRPWCRQELELFAKRKDSTKYIILVRANHVERDDHPVELRNIQGYDFFSDDDWREPGNERFFVDQGEILDRMMFLTRMQDLGSIIWRRAFIVWKRANPPPTLTLDAPETAGKGEKPEAGIPGGIDKPPAPARTIYLAKPAPDAAKVYERMANELIREGYTVVPPVNEKIPADSASAALEFIDAALGSAMASIHLLGEKPGYKPDELDHIVSLQLTRAAARSKLPPGKPDTAPFARFIWAPKSPEEDCSFPAAELREPVAVLKRFGGGCDGDQLHGDVFTAFQSYAKRELERRFPLSERDVGERPSANSRIYVWHRKNDREFARKVSGWLRKHDAEAVLPGYDDDPDNDKLHRRNLAECDSVFLCWAQATDTWVKNSASDLRSWQYLGRRERFSVRGLVLGPPPGESKTEDDMPLPSEIDEVLDLSKDDQLVLDGLQHLLDRSRANHPR
jgi:hypothetical protein